MDKNVLFEYIVYKLDWWKSKIGSADVPSFTKLRLQKILFLICAWNVSKDNMKLLNVFNRFYALPYGPVEMDIYEVMKNGSFKQMRFCGNECIYNFADSNFTVISNVYKGYVDDAINHFVSENKDYLTMPIFDLVDITHKWTVWKTSMEVAKFLGSKKEKMSSEDILKSISKEF
mgnify:CR=1 FL=1